MVDSTVLHPELKHKLRNEVGIEVYTKGLSTNTFLAPNTGFRVQPIAIDQDFRDSFKSAYKATSWVSTLNSAYFIYNPQENKQLRDFQKARFEVLRKVGDYEEMPKEFMAYYTYMPQGTRYQPIAQLASQLAATQPTSIDKILAIRDYFAGRDSNGSARFNYTDNPGVPDIPDASKLKYFLFENHKGYCAYFAGATLLLLRSLGIPSRIAVGFITVDRSNKNNGWYWYYADQAHAWVQVYFPGYGWLDFDTTVGNDEAQESPQPDGTPPMQPPKIAIVSQGIVTAIDTSKKLISTKAFKVVYEDREKQAIPTLQKGLNVAAALLYRDTLKVDLANIEPGDSITAISYAESLHFPASQKRANPTEVFASLPNPLRTDEVRVKPKRVKAEPVATKPDVASKKASPLPLLLAAMRVLLAIFLSIPQFILSILVARAKRSRTEHFPYRVHVALRYYLNQLGYERGNTPYSEYAQHRIDPRLGIDYQGFIAYYLQYKYSLRDQYRTETKYDRQWFVGTLKTIRSKHCFWDRLRSSLSVWRAVKFMVRS